MKKSLLLFGLLASFNANANLISNGGFEAYKVEPTFGIHVATNGICGGVLSTNVECTTQNLAAFAWGPSGSVNEFLEVRDNFVGVAPEGTNFAELNPSAASGIIQTFTAQAGLGSLSWFDKGRSGAYLFGNYAYNVLLNGTTIVGGSELTSDINTWTQKTFNNLTLKEGNNTLSFISLNTANDVGAQIDGINLLQTSVTTAVPEPETYGMMMLGLAMLGFVSRRRKQ